MKKHAKVTIRIVECRSIEIIDDVIEYNNTQNDIRPEDRRSKDPLQKEISNTFAKYNIPYALLHCTSIYPTPFDKVSIDHPPIFNSSVYQERKKQILSYISRAIKEGQDIAMLNECKLKLRSVEKIRKQKPIEMIVPELKSLFS